MEIKGFDKSFLADESKSIEEIEAEDFLKKVMIPSNLFDFCASVAVVLNEDEKDEDKLISHFCQAIRECNTNEEFKDFIKDVKNKGELYETLMDDLNNQTVDKTISFATLSQKLFEYGFIDEKVFRVFIWMLSTGSIDYLKDFGRFCEAEGAYIPALSIITNMFQECKVVVPHLYSFDDENYIESIYEIFPEFYNFIFDIADEDDMYAADDLVDYICYLDSNEKDDVKLVYGDLIDVVYDVLDDDDYSKDCFIDVLINKLIPEIIKWEDDKKITVACQIINNFIEIIKEGDNYEN